MKKYFVIAILGLVLGLSFNFMPQASATTTNAPVMMDTTVFHGGGCRKSSPPGQCCHMETRTGIVHCH